MIKKITGHLCIFSSSVDTAFVWINVQMNKYSKWNRIAILSLICFWVQIWFLHAWPILINLLTWSVNDSMTNYKCIHLRNFNFSDNFTYAKFLELVSILSFYTVICTYMVVFIAIEYIVIKSTHLSMLIRCMCLSSKITVTGNLSGKCSKIAVKTPSFC